MGRKVLVNILSLLTIVNLIFMTVQPPILQDMYSSYGLTDQIPNSTMFILNNYMLFIILAILIVLYLIFYNIYFNKTKVAQNEELFKKVSLRSLVVLGIMLLLTLLIYLVFILKPIMEVYTASFLFEANGI